MTEQTRVQKGIPAGGQFATSRRAEASTIVLGPETTGRLIDGDDTPYTGDILDHPLVADYIDTSTLSDADKETLRVLIEPHNVNPEANEFAEPYMLDERLSDLDAFNPFDIYDTQNLAEVLRTHFDRRDGWGAFRFDPMRDPDGGVESYQVGLSIPGEAVSLNQAEDWKYLIDRQESSSIKAAIFAANTISGDYENVRGKAIRLGLIETPTPDPTLAPATKFDRIAALAALADYDATPDDADVDVDTISIMRDALASYLADTGTAAS